jgi:hypothetical protein
MVGLSGYAAAVSYPVIEDQREEKAAKGIREKGETVCLFQSGTEDVKKTIGIGVAAQISIEDGLPETFAEPGTDEVLLSQMFENNPDLKKSMQFKEQARLSIDSATGSYLPEISLQGSYG